MLKALKGMFATADRPAADAAADDERDASGKPKVTLAKALARDWLEVWYQPKVSLQTGSWVGAEALIRARHPEVGVLGPFAFLPGAGEPELLELTERVILTALHDWEDCATLGMPQLHLAVNVPATAFVELDIARMIREESPKSDAWPGLILEVTEDHAVRDVALTQEIATQLRIYDIALALDDFGAGYSNLARLKELPFGELKLDRTIVAGCDSDAASAALCQMSIDLAHQLGAVVVGEGIETRAELQALARMGCDLGQGFLLAPPMPQERFVALLRDQAAKTLVSA